jgi:hypothetical protein
MDQFSITCFLSKHRLACGFLAVALLVAPAQASILPIEPIPADWSDFTISNLKSIKNILNGDGTSTFSLTGKATKLVVDGVTTYGLFNAPITLSAKIDLATSQVVSGGFEFNWQNGAPPATVGALPLSYYSPNPLMLKGGIFEALFTGTGNKTLQFAFNVIGGTAAPDFGGVNAIGVLNIALGQNFSFPTDPDGLGPLSRFSNAFTIQDTVGVGTLDARGGIPEPNSFVVFAGLALIATAIAHCCRADILRSKEFELELPSAHNPLR